MMLAGTGSLVTVWMSVATLLCAVDCNAAGCGAGASADVAAGSPMSCEASLPAPARRAIGFSCFAAGPAREGAGAELSVRNGFGAPLANGIGAGVCAGAGTDREGAGAAVGKESGADAAEGGL